MKNMSYINVLGHWRLICSRVGLRIGWTRVGYREGKGGSAHGSGVVDFLGRGGAVGCLSLIHI